MLFFRDILNDKRIYFWLALFIAFLAIFDANVTKVVDSLEGKTFDLLTQNRFIYPEANPDIIIVNINEHALKTYEQDFGLWPWPRGLWAEVISKTQKHNPKAIVFDMQLSELDTTTSAAKKSDESLKKVSSEYDNVFFGSSLIAEDIKATHKQKPTKNQVESYRRMFTGGNPLNPPVFDFSKIPGAIKSDDQTKYYGLGYIQLPYFSSVIKDHQVGLISAAPDKDGIIRHFQTHFDHQGWLIPTIGTQIAKYLGVDVPVSAEKRLISWRGAINAYKYISFSKFSNYLIDPRSGNLDLKDKIIIIGSTATGLHDIRSTPLYPMYPGVEILATNIDSTISLNEIRVVPVWFSISESVIFIFIMAWVFYRTENGFSDALFGAIEVSLIFLSFLLLNSNDVYLDFSATFTFGFIYYLLARLINHLDSKYDAERTFIDWYKDTCTQRANGNDIRCETQLHIGIIKVNDCKNEKTRRSISNFIHSFRRADAYGDFIIVPNSIMADHFGCIGIVILDDIRNAKLLADIESYDEFNVEWLFKNKIFHSARRAKFEVTQYIKEIVYSHLKNTSITGEGEISEN